MVKSNLPSTSNDKSGQNGQALKALLDLVLDRQTVKQLAKVVIMQIKTLVGLSKTVCTQHIMAVG